MLRYAGEEIFNRAHLIRLTDETKGDGIDLEVKRGNEVVHFKAKEGKLGIVIENLPLAKVPE